MDSTLWILGFVLLLLAWLEWIWWRNWFGHYMDRFFLVLALLAGYPGQELLMSGTETWQLVVGIGMVLLAVTAVIFGIGKAVKRRT